ncbi:hypothetical protein CALCODRAFT_512096 [Calocera cornea HHB12733]|uniref:Uncharacterized protein n=1 Tax=Calocera cornea HHB12733 TaxID=1353952 RepID=A0A165DA94_9BASI|nr:hypothetical protein CALCODRAFT_512096 [Calocera cornea HHB12733]
MSDTGSSADVAASDNDADNTAMLISDSASVDEVGAVLDGLGDIVSAVRSVDNDAGGDAVGLGNEEDSNASGIPAYNSGYVNEALGGSEDSMASTGVGTMPARGRYDMEKKTEESTGEENVDSIERMKKPTAAHIARHGHTFVPAVMLGHHVASTSYRHRRSASHGLRGKHRRSTSVWVDEGLVEEDGDRAIGGALTDYLHARGETRGEGGGDAVSGEGVEELEGGTEVEDGKEENEEKKEKGEDIPQVQYKKAAKRILAAVYGIDLDKIDVNAPRLANYYFATKEEKKKEQERRIVRGVLNAVKRHGDETEAQWEVAAKSMSDVEEWKLGYTEWKAAWRGWWAVKQVRWSKANRKRMPPSAMFFGTLVHNASVLKQGAKKGISNMVVGTRKWGRMGWSAVKRGTKATYRAGRDFATAHKRTVLVALAIVVVSVLTIILLKAPWLLPEITNWEQEIAQVVSLGANVTTLASSFPKNEL